MAAMVYDEAVFRSAKSPFGRVPLHLCSENLRDETSPPALRTGVLDPRRHPLRDEPDPGWVPRLFLEIKNLVRDEVVLGQLSFRSCSHSVAGGADFRRV